ncbi:putative E3 ubiquitin-protein ligase SINA-like 6 [Andrographis paniculata]|uniref:putative E3 ubiquitin-protein ligase SINA-like 6 n=1 Tax=Andrographis paniculata TaxID=175694 RepID=UPI0021E73406|nr:putative E3 ubiquitin-protein ligase SINA-like 6 [Andrographis paniculata]
MARFSVGGDEEDGNEDSSNNDRRLPKRLRTGAAGAPIVYTAKRSNASSSNPAGLVAASNLVNPAPPCTVAAAEEPRPEEQAPVEELSEDESEEESESSLADSSEEESEEEYEEEEEEADQASPRSGDEVSPSPEAILSSAPPDANGPAREEAARGANAQAAGVGVGVLVTLTDPDVLDCPICLEPLSSPIYQCENGHIACASCCIKMRNKCASCCWPIGYNRCRAMEKVLETVRVSCRYAGHGCAASLNYSKKLDHEKTCTYTPCSCPYLGCAYFGSSKCLYSHFTTDHPRSSKPFRFNSSIHVILTSNQKQVFLQEKHEQTLFVLRRSIEHFGSSVTVVCIAPVSSSPQFTYSLTARDGVGSIQLKTAAETTPCWAPGQRPKRYAVIPKEFLNGAGDLVLELTVWRDANQNHNQNQNQNQ